MDGRRRYERKINFNGRDYNWVVIDPHYKEKHNDLNDWVILRVLEEIKSQQMLTESSEDGFAYFTLEALVMNHKSYRLIICIPSDHEYLGVVNCYRR